MVMACFVNGHSKIYYCSWQHFLPAGAIQQVLPQYPDLSASLQNQPFIVPIKCSDQGPML